MILVCLISVIMVCHYYVFKENFLSFKNEVFSKGLRAFYVFELASDPNCIFYTIEICSDQPNQDFLLHY